MTALSALPRLLLWFLGLSLSLAGVAIAADPFARATLTTKGTIYAGQQIEVDVDVFVPNYFLSPPQFPLFDLPGTVVTMPDDRGLNLNETVNGEAFSGIRKTYVITPQAPGDYALPAAVIPFGYAAVPGQTSQGQVTLPSLKFTVAAVPGGEVGTPGVTAGEITITQTFDRDPAGLHAGDALVRTVTIRAAGLAPMMIPEPTFDTPANVQLYRHDPVLSEERTSRGDITAGLRKDVATYVFAKPGTYSLPTISLPWFNPANGSMQTAEAAGATVNVGAAPAATPALAPPAPPTTEEPFDWLWWLGIAASVVALAALIQLAANLSGRLETRLETAFKQRALSEATAFRHVLDACRDHDATRLEAALDRWSRGTGNAPLSRWLEKFADPATANAFADYRRSRYGNAHSQKAGPDYTRLRGGLKAARQRWLTESADDGGGPESDLPDLNPGLEAAPPRRLRGAG
ncbi:BatD family protein [Ensifer adhaerens]|uniref:BatD family protein n=1 Tax=Ensifer adhaerens TaxID=106592 RepID=UPI0015C3045F|nr:BatD family protein [Ensifer adhaerens]